MEYKPTTSAVRNLSKKVDDNTTRKIDIFLCNSNLDKKSQESLIQILNEMVEVVGIDLNKI